MIEVFMPKLGPSMEQAMVVRWHKSPGEAVRQGEPILDIETDKTVQEVGAEAEGVLHEILVREGESCPVGTVVARLGAPGEQPAPGPASIPEDDGIGRMLIKASPAARRVAREKGVDLATVSGTGPRGRIVADDVLRAATAAQVLASAARPEAPLPAEPGPLQERRPLSPARRVIARRMAESKQTVPHFYVAMDVDMTRVKSAREAWKAAGEHPRPTYNDFIVWAAAKALQTFPELNASIEGDELLIHADINVGMATAVADGLLVPVIRNAERMSVRGIASHSRDLASRARDRKLLAGDCEGGTFTVSNLGMHGVASFAAIINPPQCAILAVGQVAPRVVTDGESIAIRTLTTLTLSVDHRVADGVAASRFLGEVKERLEEFREGG